MPNAAAPRRSLTSMPQVTIVPTGESFAANIGGRVIGTAAAWFTITLSESNPPSAAKIAVMGAIVAGAYAFMGAALTHWLPEPKNEAHD